MGKQDDEPESEENISTVGSRRVDALFNKIELTVEMLDRFSDELVNIRRRIKANEGETSPHVRNRVTQDADQIVDEAEEATERLRDELESLKRTV